MGHRPDRARPPGPDPQRDEGDDGLTRQNRVLPTGEIVAVPARGTLMGNRGILHDADGRLGTARWRHPHWIACRLEFRKRRRPIMAPRRYTELFFLDEAVALAAGHRPCAECRRADYDRFLDAWQLAFRARPRAAGLDRTLHAARIHPRTRTQVRHHSAVGALPDGAFALIRDTAHLVFSGRLLPFSPDGYGPPLATTPDEVEVLTPEPVIEVLRAGYRPELHPTAEGVSGLPGAAGKTFHSG